MGFPGGSDDRESMCNAGDPGTVPGSGRSSGEGNGNPQQYSCLENPMDRGGYAESDTTETVSMHTLQQDISELEHFQGNGSVTIYSIYQAKFRDLSPCCLPETTRNDQCTSSKEKN